MGGLGGYGAYTMTPAEIVRLCEDMRAATARPYNINLWVSNNDIPREGLTDARFGEAMTLLGPYFEEMGVALPEKPEAQVVSFEDQVQAILDARPPVFSFVFGIPSADVLEQCRRHGIVTVGAATTLDEALALDAAGVDCIVASGSEAGGHRPSFMASAEASLVGTFVLVQQLKGRVRAPVVAAGGIATGKGIAAALLLGADAVQVGTAFLACEESGAPPFHRELLFSGRARYSVLTKAFSGRLGRGLMNRIASETAGKESSLLPFPLQSRLMGALRKAAMDQKEPGLFFAWAGQITTELQHRRVADLMKSLIDETQICLDNLKLPKSSVKNSANIPGYWTKKST
jgi:nitronate monooxygenase